MHSHRAFSSADASLACVARRILSLLVVSAVLTGMVLAQTDRERQRAAVLHLAEEGAKLYQEGSKESLEKAIGKFEQALEISRAMGDQGTTATLLTNIGKVYFDLGEKQKALDCFTQALPLSRAVGDRQGEALILNGIGLASNALGEKQKALDYLNQALPLTRAANNRDVEATTLNNIGLVYFDIGETQKALDYYNRSLPLSHTIGDKGYLEETTLNNIGAVYDALGERQKALDYYNRSLPLSHAAGDQSGEALTLANIGKAYNALGQKQKALDYFTRALPLSRAVGDRGGEALILNGIGAIYSLLGEKQKALDYFNQVLPLWHAVGDRRGEATTLSNIGGAYFDLGEKQKALDYLTQSLPLSRAIGDKSGEALTLYNIAYLERDHGNLSQARTRIEEALSIIESLRTRITDQQLRSSYFASVQDYYEFYIDLLMRLHKLRPSAGFDRLALQAGERARARILLETLAEAGSDIRQGIDPVLLKRERSAQQRLNAAAQRQITLLSAPHSEAQASAALAETSTLTAELDQVETEIREKSPRYAALTEPRPLSLSQIQAQVLDPDTLLLEYSLGADRSYLWAVTNDSLTSYELPKRAEIEAAAHRVYDLLDRRNRAAEAKAQKYVEDETPAQRRARITAAVEEAGRKADIELRSAAADLSRMILSPAAAKLGKKRLLIVGDGTLQYIPFAVLPSPNSKPEEAPPLIVEHEITNAPSASTLAVLRQEDEGRRPAPKLIAVIADPVFSRTDKRFKTAPQGPDRAANLAIAPKLKRGIYEIEDENPRTSELRIPRLPGTRREAEAILALAPKGANLQAFDFEASHQTVTSPELGQYRYVHFATHGFLDSEHVELSGVLLSMYNERGEPEDGFLRAHEIFNLKLPAEMVVLSACQTGLGKEVRGEGLVGLTRGFMYAGAPRVVVSLWSVNDEATAELMTRFYKGIFKDGMRPAQALQAAQVTMLKEKNFTSPYYWAAFIMQGEWR